MSQSNTGGGPKKVIGGTGTQQQSILELSKMMDSVVRVKCIGGRELQGILRGYDDLVNLVIDDCDEYLRGKCSLPLVLKTQSFITTSSIKRRNRSFSFPD
jgi:small nuclear ribonucleoprotein (snRNP)-like protein